MAKIVCPNPECRMVSDLPDQYLGRQVACKHCKAVFVATAVGGGAKPSEIKTMLVTEPPAGADQAKAGVIEALCPTCGAVFNLKEDYKGKKVRCKKCEQVFTVGGEARADDDDRAVQPRAGAVAPRKKGAKDDDDEDRSTSRKSRVAAKRGRDDDDDDDDDRRGRKRKRVYHDDDDDDDRPRKRAPKSSGSSTGKVLAIVGGVLFLLLLVCGGGIYGFVHWVSNVAEDIDQAQQNANNFGPGGFGPAGPGGFEGFPGFDQQPKDLPEALTFLKGNDPNQRRGAANYLSKLQADPARQKEVATAVEPLLKEVDDNTCAAGARALRVWGSKDNGPALTQALRLRLPDQNRPFLGDAQKELMGAIADVKYDPGAEVVVQFLPNFFSGGEAEKALATHGAGAEKAVVKYFDHPDGGARGKARGLIQRYNTKPAVILDQVVVDLGAVEVETNKAAIEWLSQPGSEGALKLATAEPARRTAVATGLNRTIDGCPAFFEDTLLRAVKRWGTKDNAPALVSFLRKSPFKKREIADALIAIGPGCEPQVRPLLNDTDRGVANEAKRIIAAVGSPDAKFDAVLADLESNDGGRIALGARSLQTTPVDEKARPKVVSALIDTLSNTGPGRTDRDCTLDVSKALVIWAKKDDGAAIAEKVKIMNQFFAGQSRKMLIEWMGKEKVEKAIPFLAAALTDRDIYQTASKALQTMGPDLGEVIEAQFQSITTNDPNQLGECFKVLGAVGTKKSLPLLKTQQAAFTQKKNLVLASACQEAINAITARGK